MGACAGACEGREGVGATRTLVGVAWVIVPEEEACATGRLRACLVMLRWSILRSCSLHRIAEKPTAASCVLVCGICGGCIALTK